MVTRLAYVTLLATHARLVALGAERRLHFVLACTLGDHLFFELSASQDWLLYPCAADVFILSWSICAHSQ